MMSRTPTVPAVDAEQEKRLRRAARNMTVARTQLEVEILEAFLAGAGVREIARTVDMSHPGVKYILDKHAENPAFLEEQRKRRTRFEGTNDARRERERRWKEEQNKKS